MKSPPELWSELSEVAGLARHLGEFGEIRITKVEPEKTVAWEGEHASGTVEIEASGWGTKVTLTAAVTEPPAEATPEPPPPQPRVVEAEAPAAVEAQGPAPEPHQPRWEPPPAPVVRQPERRGFLSRLLGGRSRSPLPAGPVPQPPPIRREPPAPPQQAAPEPAVVGPEEPPGPPEPAVGPDQAQAVLEGALDSLGSAHHRPFSRG